MSNRFLMPLAAFSLVAACGPKEPAPAPAVPGATAVADVVPAPSAPATPTPTPTPSPTPAEPEVATGPDGYLVWFQGGEKGHETHWLGRDAVGAYSALATRPQAALVAAGTLWLVEPRHVPYRETSCEVLEMEEDAQVKPAPGPRRHLEYLVARAVSGPRADDVVELTKPRSAYFDDTPDSAGVYGMIGEHYGRSHELDGAADGLIFGTSCEGAYSCGAHGDYACDFFVHAFGDPERRFDLAAIQKSLTAETQAVFAAWEKEAEGEYSEPGLEAIAMLAGKGNPAIRHRFVMEVSYVASGGDWGSYTQSRDVVAPPTPIHGLSDVLHRSGSSSPREASRGPSAGPRSRTVRLRRWLPSRTPPRSPRRGRPTRLPSRSRPTSPRRPWRRGAASPVRVAPQRRSRRSTRPSRPRRPSRGPGRGAGSRSSAQEIWKGPRRTSSTRSSSRMRRSSRASSSTTSARSRRIRAIRRPPSLHTRRPSSWHRRRRPPPAWRLSGPERRTRTRRATGRSGLPRGRRCAARPTHFHGALTAWVEELARRRARPRVRGRSRCRSG